MDAFEYGQIPSPTWPLRSRNFIKHPVSMSVAHFTGMLFVTLTRLDIYSGGAYLGGKHTSWPRVTPQAWVRQLWCGLER